MELFRKNTALKKKLLLSVQLKKGGYNLRYALLKKGASYADIQFAEVDSLEEFLKIKKHTPICIHVHGFGVLARQIENKPNYEDSLIVSGDKTDFYFSSFEDDNQINVAFVRRSLLAEINEKLEEQKAFVFELWVGPIPLMVLYEKYNSISADYSIKFKDRNVFELAKNEIQNESRVDTFYLESFVDGLEENEALITQALDQQSTIAVQNNYKEYKRFVNLGIGILVFFLLALSANYFYVNHLNQKSAELEAELTSYQENLSLIDRLEQEKQRKLILIENSGIQSDNYLTYYLDEIGASIISSIHFQNLELFPLKEPLKPKRKVEPDVTNVVVKGNCNNSKVLDDWIENLEAIEWVGSVEVMNYVRLSKTKANFHIQIKLRV